MSRRALTFRLAKETGIPIRQTTQLLRVLVDLVVDELAHTRRLEWRRLGTFSVRSYSARKIHVPATGQTLELAARAGVTFKPSRLLLAKLEPKTVAKKPSRRPAVSSPPPPPPTAKHRRRKKPTSYLGTGYCELCIHMWPADWKPALTGRGLFRCLGCNQELDLGLRMPPTLSTTKPVPRPGSYRRESLAKPAAAPAASRT